MAEAGLHIEVTKLLKPELGIQRYDVLLSVQQHGFGAVQVDHLGDKHLRETLTATVGANGDATKQATGVPVAGFGIQNHPQVGGGAMVILNPEVFRGGFLVAIIELFFIDSLLDKEHVGAQLQKRVELCGGEFAPRFAYWGTFRHTVDFNVRELAFSPELPPPPRTIPKECPMAYNVNKSEDEWRAELGPEQYKILREAATERAWSGELLDESRSGFYTCAACNAELFKSGTKFDSHCGWPSFYESVNPEAVELLEDTSLGVVRTEVRCANCGSHLGHVFDDGFGTPTGDRYCMNSLSLGFTEAAE